MISFRMRLRMETRAVSDEPTRPANRHHKSVRFCIQRVLRFLCVAVFVLPVAAAPAAATDTLRVGFQSTGTFAWVLDVIRRHGLAQRAELDIKVTEFASPDAGKLALNGGSVDVAISDWLWVARERALGSKLLFYPYSSAVGAVMVKADSPV